MYCPQCRSELPDDAKYCIKCGYDFTKIKTPPERKSIQDSLDISGTIIQQESDIDRFRAGTIFANRYEILSDGLKGGMGTVFKCKDNKLNKTVALKVIHPRLLESKEALARFRQEVSISQELQHPNIVKVFNLEEWEGTEYFTMEWVDGVTLREIINQRKKDKRPFTIEEAYRIISQLSDALSYAHNYTIHRDIKPENILVANDSELKIKLTDFGIAKMLTSIGLTSISMQMGTPYYMAPEQKTDAAHVDKRADIYALGVVLFELLTLENTIGLEMPSEINSEVPKQIDNVIKKALSSKPEQRQSDTKEFSDALQKCLLEERQRVDEEIRKAEEQRKKEEELRKQEETERIKKVEEQKRQEEEKRRKEDDRKRQKEEKKKIEVEEQENKDYEQMQHSTVTKTSQQSNPKASFNKVIIVVSSIVLIVIIYMLNSKRDITDQSLVLQNTPLIVESPDGKGTPPLKTSPVTPYSSAPITDSRFVFSNLTVFDRETGLVWARNANLSGLLFRESASEFIEELNAKNYAGFNDWRIPSKNELETLITFGNSQGTEQKLQDLLNKIGFNNVQKTYYWSSTISKSIKGTAWVLIMNDCKMYDNFMGSDSYVWPVRTGR
jgi:serine/threonine protein kinase